MTHAMPRLIGLASLVVLFGCSGEEPSNGGSGGSSTVSGGSSSVGSGGISNSGGASSANGGSSSTNGGSSNPTAGGSAPANGGATAAGAAGASTGSGGATPSSGGRTGGNGGRTGSASGGSNSGTGGAALGGSNSGGSTSTSGGAATGDRAAEVCRRWTEDRKDMGEGTWSGSVASCDAGDLSSPGRENALKLVNLYRFLADMPTVVMDPARNTVAQQCALMQSANGLSHEPPTTWKCYTAEGAKASSMSSISGGKGVRSIDAYMTDGSASNSDLGHRRWLFANSLGPVGFGSATSSCFHQTGGTGKANKTFVAWPPPGPVPLAAMTTTQLDTSGWHIQSDTVNVNTATVTITEGGQNRPIMQYSLAGGYGSRYAVRMVPQGWKAEAGKSYTVTVAGTAVTYTVDVLACTN